MVIGVVAAESTRQRLRKAILLHSCPRCHGDLFLQAEEEGEEFVCLQCAGSVPATMIAGIPRALSPRRERPR